MNARVDLALAHWSFVAPLLKPARNDKQYRDLVASLDAILDAGGADERNPLAGLAAMIGELVSAYETNHHAMLADTTTPASHLEFLMAEHQLRQADLPEIGNQAKVSEILAGKRQINLRQAKSLALRFNVPMELFAA